jgi:uncharacterized membrane protein
MYKLVQCIAHMSIVFTINCRSFSLNAFHQLIFQGHIFYCYFYAMKPFIVLAASFALSCLAFFAVTHNAHVFFCGRIAMAAMMLFTSIAHFVFYKGMMLMLPGFIPFKKSIVYITGIIEIAAAIGLIIPKTHFITAVLLIIFFLLILPSNIVAAKQKINIEKATYEGNGLSYLWFRIPLQVFFIGWVLYFAILH